MGVWGLREQRGGEQGREDEVGAHREFSITS
jgi:hypothetical protein